jgi:hypothetical protein
VDSIGIALNTLLAILATALNIFAQDAVIGGRSDLKTRLNVWGYICLVTGFLFMLMGGLIQGKLLPWGNWTSSTASISAGTILFFPCGVSLLVQGAKLEKTGDALKEVARDQRTLAEWLINLVAVTGAIIIVIVDVFITLWWISLSR